MATGHPTKTISYNGLTAEIDEDIAELVLNCWRLGIMTNNSCQNNIPDNWVWLCFNGAINAQYFMSIVAPTYSEDPNSIYYRIGHHDEDNSWQYDSHLDDHNVEGHEENDEWVEKPMSPVSNFSFDISVRFPRTDLEAVCAKINRHARRWGKKESNINEDTGGHIAALPGYDPATRSVISQGPDNCVDCDVSFEDYPEMRTGGSKCSTCSKE